jgi:hypothetical protein
LGVSSPEAVRERLKQIRSLMPDLRQVTEKILATNPAIRD